MPSLLRLVLSHPISQPRPSRRTTIPKAAEFHRLVRDRIGPDGDLHPSENSNSPLPPPSNYVIGTPIANTHPAPISPPPSDEQLDQLAEFVEKSGAEGVLILTGAGCSTESNVPDYRGPGGAYSTGFKPMTHQAFLKSPENRSRYWARSFVGWERFSTVQPNAAHEAIAKLQLAGLAGHVLTQNVDRLHHKAGSPSILELHGTTHEVICMNCKALTPREEVQRWLARVNPEAAEAAEVLARAQNDPEYDSTDERERLMRAGTALPVPKDLREAAAGIMRPDGDIEIAQMQFHVPACPSCGGILKPDVVFFGDSLPKERSQRALELAENATGVLVVGSSLAVWSAYRLLKAAKSEGRKGVGVAIVNVGPTRADDLADLKLEVRAGDAMMGLKQRLI